MSLLRSAGGEKGIAASFISFNTKLNESYGLFKASRSLLRLLHKNDFAFLAEPILAKVEVCRNDFSSTAIFAVHADITQIHRQLQRCNRLAPVFPVIEY